MSQIREPRGVDSDRVDGGRKPWRPVAVFLLLGAVVGGGLGYQYGSGKAPTYQAYANLQVQPDSVIYNTQPSGTGITDTSSYLQGQLVVLNGTKLAAQVQSDLKLTAAPDVNSTQVGASNVVRITATAGSSQTALAVANDTATRYVQQRSAAFTAAIKGLMATNNAAQAATKASVLQLQAAVGTAAGATGATNQNALELSLAQLIQTANNLKTALPQTTQLVPVLQVAKIAPAPLSAAKKDLLAGALVGALFGLAALIALRRLLPRIRAVSDVAALGVPVLLPVVTRRQPRVRSGAAAWQTSEGRLLAARLTGAGPAADGPVTVVGATPGVGTSFVAATLAAGLAERGPVLLVLAAEMVNGARRRQLAPSSNQTGRTAGDEYGSDDPLRHAVLSVVPGVWLLPCDDKTLGGAAVLPGARSATLNSIIERATQAGWLSVVDAPALSDSDLALLSTTSYGTTALVVGRGRSRPADVLSAAELFDAHGNQFVGAIFNDVPRRRQRRRPVQTAWAPSIPERRVTTVESLLGAYSAANAAESTPVVELPVATLVQNTGGGRRRAPTTSGLRHGARGSR